MNTTPAQTFFTELGERIEKRWATKRFDERALPDVAHAALMETPPHQATSMEDIARWMISAPSLGLQPNGDSTFGEPALTLFAGRRFYIEALYWLDGTTTIHQHAFDGAFCVLGGGSIHSTYGFVPAERLSARLLLGDVTHQSSEVMRPGDARVIRSGDEFVHSLFHYERPSVSIVVRSYFTPSAPVQFNYDPPYVAVAPKDREVWARRATDLVNVAVRCGWKTAGELTRTALLNADDHAAYLLLGTILQRAPGLDLEQAAGPGDPSHDALRAAYDSAVKAAHEKFGSFAAPILRSCERTRRDAEIIAARQRVADPSHRKFLALVLNVPSRRQLLQLVSENFPGEEPVDRICAWLRELGSESSSVLDYELGEDALRLVSSMLHGDSMEQIEERFAESLGRPLSAGEATALAETAGALRELPIIQPMFAHHLSTPFAEEVRLARGMAAGA